MTDKVSDEWSATLQCDHQKTINLARIKTVKCIYRQSNAQLSFSLFSIFYNLLNWIIKIEREAIVGRESTILTLLFHFYAQLGLKMWQHCFLSFAFTLVFSLFSIFSYFSHSEQTISMIPSRFLIRSSCK